MGEASIDVEGPARRNKARSSSSAIRRSTCCKLMPSMVASTEVSTGSPSTAAANSAALWSESKRATRAANRERKGPRVPQHLPSTEAETNLPLSTVSAPVFDEFLDQFLNEQRVAPRSFPAEGDQVLRRF